MKLILTVTSEQRTGMGPQCQHVFDDQGGTIGRAPDSDWILPDMNRIVSSQHSVIEFRDGGFYLTDTSTNGVFLNEAEKPLGYGSAVRLQGGDTLGIGEYRIRTEVEPTSVPVSHEDSSRSVNEAVFESSWPDSANSEPMPLGLNGDNGVGLGSKSSLPLPNERYRTDKGGDHPPASQPDHSPAINDAFSLPPARVELLPEDWDKVIDNDEVRNTDGISPQSEPLSDDGFLSSQPQLESISLDSALKSGSHDTSAGAVPQIRSDNHSNTINEFLRGAGVASTKVRTDNPKLSLEHIGRHYREMVQGVMEVLIARSTLKNEFRMPHTIIRATENNPLKFSMGVDDALEYLLLKEGNGFLPAEEAIREAYQDIKDHQFATVAGMRAAFESVLLMFSPEQLQSKFKSGSKLGRLLPRNRKAANWELYEEWYSSLASDAGDHFQQLFAKAFGHAYEEQIARLSAARKQHKT
jgi:type VI secretion system protein